MLYILLFLTLIKPPWIVTFIIPIKHTSFDNYELLDCSMRKIFNEKGRPFKYASLTTLPNVTTPFSKSPDDCLYNRLLAHSLKSVLVGFVKDGKSPFVDFERSDSLRYMPQNPVK